MIIGFSGKMGSGKDLAADIVQYLFYMDTFARQETVFKQGTIFRYSLHEFLDVSKQTKTVLSKVENVKFADAVKDIVCILTGCTREQLEDREFKETSLGEDWIRYGYADGFIHNGKTRVMNNVTCSKERYKEELQSNWQTAYKSEITPRWLMQFIGTDLFRNRVHHNIWVNALMSKYRPIGYEKGSNKYIADVLEDIHFNTLLYPKWVISDVRFPNEIEAIEKVGGIVIRLSRNNGVPSDHISETSLDEHHFDWVINNNESVLELAESIHRILIFNECIHKNTELHI